jgi:hypothetical protein
MVVDDAAQCWGIGFRKTDEWFARKVVEADGPARGQAVVCRQQCE